MCGVVSGRHGHLRAATCEDDHAIDLAWLLRQGVLKRGGWSILTWSRGGERIASIEIKSEAHSLHFRYRTRTRGNEEWQEINEGIRFAFTDTNFRGRRRWFKCPSCERLCRVLYGGECYRCRKCHGLKYESQYATGWQRVERQADRIWRRLGGTECDDESFPPKPKGMHWSTYERLSRRYETLTGEFLQRFGARIEELAAKTERRRAQAREQKRPAAYRENKCRCSSRFVAVFRTGN